MSEKVEQQTLFEFEERKTIKGYPELRWTGKRPYTSTQYYPAQHKETYGEADENGWLNKIFWGDNLQVMSHLLKEYRGKIDLIYIDPPFDSKAEYKLKVILKGKSITNDINVFEEKQYSDIWSNDEYLQFMYERLILLKELLSDSGSIYLHCDWHKVHHLRMLMDEVFGPNNFVNEIIWSYRTAAGGKGEFNKQHDNILFYQKSKTRVFNEQKEKSYTKAKGRKAGIVNYGAADTEFFEDDEGVYRWSGMRDVWEIPYINSQASERSGYPTQKPEAIIERIVEASSRPGNLVFDCFMGSGTTQAVAMKLGRRFLGADINLGAIQTTAKRLNKILKGSNRYLLNKTIAGFEVYNVNNYDFFRNPVEAKELLIEALNIQPFSQRKTFDGELDGRNVKIMPVNRIATRADLAELIANLPYTSYDRKKEDNPNTPVDYITLVCMGHEPDLLAAFKQEVSAYKLDVQIVDILTDKKDFEFKREAKADVVIEGNRLVIKSFYPMNLMQKLSLQKEHVDDYKQLVESVVIDWNYDGTVLRPDVVDIPEKNDLIKGSYKVPNNRGTIRIKITDLLSESLEIEVK